MTFVMGALFGALVVNTIWLMAIRRLRKQLERRL